MRNICGPLLLLQGFVQVSNVLCLLLLLKSFLFDALSSENLTVFPFRRRAIEHPDRLYVVFEQQDCSVEQAKQMACLVPILICQLSDKVGVWWNSLGRHQKLVHGHWGIQGHNHILVVFDVSLFYRIRCLIPDQIHEFVDSHRLAPIDNYIMK